jgi:Zn-dependent protease
MRLTFSKTEIIEIIKAWIAVSLVFAIALVGLNTKLAIALPIALLTGGIAFLLHELAHKYVAQSYRCWAEFRAHDTMLVISVLLSLTGIVLLAPGGVYIHGATRHQHGKIAFAGPLMNIILAIIFLGLGMLSLNGLLQAIVQYGAHINAYLAIFNMIPFPPFDGHTVWQWNKAVYVIGIVAAGLLLILQNI